MIRSSYLIRRIENLNYQAMFDTARKDAKITGKTLGQIFSDMGKCALLYGAGYMDYDLFRMYQRTERQRDTFLTRGRNNELVRQYNDPAFIHIFDNKDEFDEAFEPFLHREWAPIGHRARCLELIEKHGTVFAKPGSGSCGKGIEKLSLADFDSAQALYAHVASYHTRFVLEEAICQHPVMKGMYPDAINTIRVVTIVKNGQPHVICAYLRIGSGGRSVDNFNSGGMTSPVDEKTGTVLFPAMDKSGNVYETHPATGTAIQGFQIPLWDKILPMVREAAMVVPQVAYIGWDIGIAQDGPLIVEGNNFAGHDIYQLPAHTPDGYGIYPKFLV